MNISIEVTVRASLARVWSAWTTPQDIVQWNYATDEWCCPRATINLKPGGKFSYRMEAKDGSMGFDFEGDFTDIEELRRIQYRLGDERKVEITFSEQGLDVHIKETFEAEDSHTAEQQRLGWQCILNNFKKHVEKS